MTDGHAFIRHRFTPLRTLEPDAPAADLEPLLELVGGARVVALGESDHQSREFARLRHRLLRTLAADGGVYAAESGFADADSVDAWVRGGPGEVAEAAAGIGFRMGENTEVQAMLRWMRARTGTGAAPVRFAGLDLASSAGSPQPALHAAEDGLAALDPNVLPLVRSAREATRPYSAASSALALERYKELDGATRDAATAAVSRALSYLLAVRPMYHDHEEYTLALHHLWGAWLHDQYVRELVDLTGGSSLLGVNSSRDVYMAESVRWLRQHHDRRVLAAVHNGHLQRHSFSIGGTTPILPMGLHLADLGSDYVAIGMTSGGGSTTGLTLDPQAPLGFRVYPTDLPPPEPESVEALLAGYGPGLLDLREAPASGPQRMRHADRFVSVPVWQAFDALLYVPSVRPAPFVTG